MRTRRMTRRTLRESVEEPDYKAVVRDIGRSVAGWRTDVNDSVFLWKEIDGLECDVEYFRDASNGRLGVSVDVDGYGMAYVTVAFPDDLASVVTRSIDGIEDAVKDFLYDIDHEFSPIDVAEIAVDPDDADDILEGARKCMKALKASVKRAVDNAM